jgi:hypothetical protein
MEPPSSPPQEYAALLAENLALKERVAALEARRAELERLEEAVTAASDHQATDLEVPPPAKGQPDPDGGD